MILGASLDEFVNNNLHRRPDGFYGCNLCDYVKDRKDCVQTHIESNHAPLHLKQVTCAFCGYVCPSKGAMIKHLKKHQ